MRMARLTTDFGKLFACRPANLTAAIVSSPPRNSEDASRSTATHWEAPPMVVSVPAATRDLTGRSFGRLTVRGLLSPARRLWLVRCVCGDYEQRTADAVERPVADDSCSVCAEAASVRASATSARVPSVRSRWAIVGKAGQPREPRGTPVAAADRAATPPRRSVQDIRLENGGSSRRRGGIVSWSAP